MKKLLLQTIAGITLLSPLAAQKEPQKPGADGEVIPPEVSEADKTAATTEVVDSYYVAAKSYGTQPIDSAKPAYAKRLSETGINAFKDLDWITFGIQQRTRQEYHANDFRQTNYSSITGYPTTAIPNTTPGNTAGAVAPPDTNLTLFKTAAFLKLEFNWFRLVGEIQDSRRTETFYSDTDGRDINTIEPIQAYAELHFKNLFGYDRPLTVRGGRFSLELLDRRLVGLNDWRNTTNTFQGGRILIGSERNDWNLDLIGAQPLQRYLYDIDQPLGNPWFYGGVLTIQRWSNIVTLQPFYLGYQQDGYFTANLNADGTPTTPPLIGARNTRNFHTAGLRAYGVVGKTGFDYDVSYIQQYGIYSLSSDTKGNAVANNINAFAFWGEIGYTLLKNSWKPRLAGFYAYISGDNNGTTAASSGQQEGFDRLFGFGRPWSSNDYFRAENLNNPKIILEFEPIEKLKIDTAYAWYWTADPHSGISGLNIGNGTSAVSTQPTNTAANATNYALYNATSTKIGEEWNIRIRYPFPHLRLNAGYAYFVAGDWLAQVKRGGVSHFAYLEATVTLWN